MGHQPAPVYVDQSDAGKVAAALGSAANGLTAKAGGAQVGATALAARFCRFTVVATAADSAILPPAQVGAFLTVKNTTANSMNVFPAVGEQINALGANAAFALAGGKSCEFFCAMAGVWDTLLSA